jgi:hypothetical protein
MQVDFMAERPGEDSAEPHTALLGITRLVCTLVRSVALITAVWLGRTPSAAGRASAEVSTAEAGFMVAEASTVVEVGGSKGSSRTGEVAQQHLHKENKIMQHITVQRFSASQVLRLKTTLAIGTIILAITSVPSSSAQKSTQESFPTAEAASHALLVAVQSDSEQPLTQILGGGTELVSTEDRAEDRLERQQFAKKYEDMHRLVREPDGTTVLYVGAENWPFPVPLASKAGAWYFDGAAGKEEVLFRRIGENEATAIEACHALVLSKQGHSTTTTADDPVIQYAQTFVASHEKGSEAPASKEVPAGPFHGYYFRILSGQRKRGPGANVGFTFIAYPAEYRSSGVLTFAVGQDNVVYEKNLGPDTAKLAKKTTVRTPFSSWNAAE